MDRPVRIAVVGPVDERLIGDLRQLPLGPEVRPLSSVVADTEALMRFQPDVLLTQLHERPSEDIGAIKRLRRLWPAMVVGVLADAGSEVSMGPIAERLSAELVVYPATPGQLAAALEQLLHGGDRPRPELFVDLAHGLADGLLIIVELRRVDVPHANAQRVRHGTVRLVPSVQSVDAYPEQRELPPVVEDGRGLERERVFPVRRRLDPHQRANGQGRAQQQRPAGA